MFNTKPYNKALGLLNMNLKIKKNKIKQIFSFFRLDIVMSHEIINGKKYEAMYICYIILTLF